MGKPKRYLVQRICSQCSDVRTITHDRPTPPVRLCRKCATSIRARAADYFLVFRTCPDCGGQARKISATPDPITRRCRSCSRLDTVPQSGVVSPYTPPKETQMIHCKPDKYGDYDVYASEGGPHIGVLEKGRAMTDLVNNWDEWQFVPDALASAKGPVRRSRSAAREDARVYATTLQASDV